MESFDTWFGRVANSLTILAAIIAIAGVVWAVRSRAKLKVTSSSWPSLVPSITFHISSDGSNPVRNLDVVGGQLTPHDFSMHGDAIVRRPELHRGEHVLVDVFDPAETHHSDPPRANEYRWEIHPDEGFYMQVRWQSPLFSWRQESRTYVWSTADRYALGSPQKLTGRAELRFLKRTQDFALNPTLSTFSPPPRIVAQLATDHTFDALLSGYRGVSLVGLGPTWQGAHWLNVQRALSAFASKHAKQVQTLFVNTDESPGISSRYDVNVAPTFMAFSGGEIVATHDGLSSYQDLETTFVPLLARRHRNSTRRPR
ncbi:thioredoxin family protein [Microbacterium sp. A588]